MKIVTLPEIKNIIDKIDIEILVKNQESGFVAYSEKQSVVPLVGHLEFLDPPGDCHIKYGYIQNDDSFAIKIATGFYNNTASGLSNGNGLILVFNSKTGIPQSILLDEGYLTDIRTAIAGLIAAKYLAPKNISGIGIFGTGCQAKLQLKYLLAGLPSTQNKKIWVWGRSTEKLQAFQKDMNNLNLKIQITTDPQLVLNNCNLLITTTTSKGLLFKAELVQVGTHITAIGADSPGKQELDPYLFKHTDICIVDSKKQCYEFGDISHAIKSKIIPESKVIELGKLISTP